MPAASTPRPRHTSPASRHADRASAPKDSGNPEQSRNRCPPPRERKRRWFSLFFMREASGQRGQRGQRFPSDFAAEWSARSARSAVFCPFQSPRARLSISRGSIAQLFRPKRIEGGVTKKEPSNRGLLSLWVFTNNVALFLVPILTSSRLNLRSTMIKRAYHSSHSVQSSWVLRT